MVACPFQGFPTKPGCYGIMHDGKEGDGLGSLGPGGVEDGHMKSVTALPRNCCGQC